MAAIQFPNNPNAGDLFTASNGIRYTYDGEKWKTLGTSTVGTEGQFLETPTELTIDKVIPGNTNTGAVGSLAIGPGVTLTVPASSSFRTLSGKSGTYGIPETGGTFTGPVSFDDNTIIKGNSTDGSGELTLNCENNSHGIKIKGPPHSAGATYTLILPNDTGTSGQVLTTNGSGVSSWSSVLPLTGGTLTGSLTGTTANFSGNVGIGTSSPGQLLHLNSSASTAIQISDGTNNQFISSIKTAGNFANGSTAGDIFIRGQSGFAVSSNNGSSVAMRIDSAGNVGIGTTSPTEKLHIVTSSNDDGILVKTTGSNSNALDFDANRSGVGNAIASIRGKWNGTTVGQIAFLSGSDTTNKDDGVITFGTESAASNGNVNATERMRIDSSGRVGINISNPSSYNSAGNELVLGNTGNNGGLTIVSGTGNNGHIFFADGTSGGALNRGIIKYEHGSDAMAFNTAESERLRINSSGNVGIGTTSLNERLNVHGTSYAQMQFTTNGTGTASGDGFRVGWNGSVAQMWCFENADMRFATSNGERMRIDSSGRLLLGTTAVGPTAGEQLTIAGSSNAGMTIRSSNSSAGSILFEDTASDRGEIQYSHNGDYMRFKTAGSERMRIDESGQTSWYRNTDNSGVSVIFVQSNVTSTQRVQWYVLADGDNENRTGVYTTISSDERMKKDIVDASSQWEDIKNIRMRKFRYKANGDESPLQLGVIAQELELVCPNLVTKKPATAEMSAESEGLIAEGEDILSWKQSIVHLKALKALQEAMERIETLEQRLSDADIA